MTAPLAWHGDADLKAQAVALMRAHRDADSLIQGAYALYDPTAARAYRGCFHGCLTTERLAAEHDMSPAEFALRVPSWTDWHGEGERLWGIPADVGSLLDYCFELLPAGEHGAFAVAATEAIPVGADLGGVPARLMFDLLTDPDHGAAPAAAEGSPLRAPVEQVIALYRRLLDGDTPPAREWDDAALAVDAADRDTPHEVYVASVAYYAACRDLTLDLSGRTDEYRRWLAGRLLALLADAPIPAEASR